ncbi:hypothetical protein FDECE_3331 [Fusarium decemcellulare]|nr:hypothetical protein FDECE_3331 [Fusarium decemcellulare]
MAAINLRKAGFTGRLLEQESPEFKPASHRFSAISERKARFIAFPKSAQDVSTAVVFATKFNLKIAIKCGGHHASGSNSVEDGLVIDLGDLKYVHVNEKNNSVNVAGGSVWGDVYPVLRDHGIVCVGGGVHDVGVGGHLTGGGFGPLTHKFGMACDNVLSVKVVLADGRIVVANEEENHDLFWAIKGGSSQFGVVTEFTLRTFPDPGPFYFRSVGIRNEDLSTLIPRYEDFIHKRHGWEDGMLVFLGFLRKLPENIKPLIVANITGLGSVNQHAELFSSLFDGITPIFDHFTDCPSPVEISHVMDDLLLGGPRRIATAGVPITAIAPGLLQNVWDDWLNYTASNPDSLSTKVVFELHGTKRYRPELSCIPVQAPVHHMVLLSEEHNDAVGDDRALDWVRKLSAHIRHQHTLQTGEDLGLHANGCMSDQKVEDLWGQSLPRLRRVKAKYDPKCIFDRGWHIDPDFAKL